ncbi:DUF4062 domain-containing protein [bacterium]|nr:DUF4062 domain-containing protein [bacterium]
MKETVFISSRINELVSERSVTFRACVEEGFTPLMFETEPIEDVKHTIDRMVDAADHFIGIFFHTVGTPQLELKGMTPIEYELAKFIRNKCLENSENNSCKLKEKRKEIDCLKKLRRIFTGHYPLDHINIQDKIIQGPNEISDCMKSLVLIGRMKKIHLYCKYPFDENSLSPELLVLIQGLQNLHFNHEDFSNRWELSLILHKEFREIKSKAETDNSSDLPSVWVSFKGCDEVGQIAQLTRFAFSLNQNVDFLSSKKLKSEEDDAENRVDMNLKLSLWRKTKGDDNITSDDLVERNRRFMTFSQELGQLRNSYFKNCESIKEDLANWLPEKEMKEQSSINIFTRFHSLRLDKFVDPAQIIVEPINENAAKSTISGIVDDFFNAEADLDLYLNKCFFRVKVIHLDVPGLMFRITNLLAGNKRDRFPFVMNIKMVIVNEYRENILFRIGVTKTRSKECIDATTIKDKKSEVPWNMRSRWLQSTEMILELVGNKEIDKTCLDSFQYILHSALFSIVGVESVHVAPVKWD